jgi:predicted metal-dependent hydrolase
MLGDIGNVSIYKNKKSRSLKLSVKSDGQLRLTMPVWVPYSTGINFIQKNKNWISEHKISPQKALKDQQKIGKEHRIIFIDSDSKAVRSLVKDNYITIYVPNNMSIDSELVQNTAIKASKKALKKESSELIPSRVNELAEIYGFSFNNIRVRSLKGRWGSCSQKKDLTFNIFLMQLPQHLIDYVIIHELVHTKHMNHGPAFWDEFGKYLENPKEIKKEMINYSPIISIAD